MPASHRLSHAAPCAASSAAPPRGPESRSARLPPPCAASGGVRAQADVAAGATLRRPVLDDTISFLRTELTTLFEPEGGVTRAKYATNMTFEDPITRLEGLDSYVLMVRAIKAASGVKFDLHSLRVTGPDEITTRWTMGVRVWALPWRPNAVFTGRSKYRVDPRSGLIVSQVDTWDAVTNNSFPSAEGVALVVRQALDITQTPDLESPRYSVLRAARGYEVRKYDPFVVAEAPMGDGSTPAGANGFNELAFYIFGNNAQRAKMEMTTPVLSEPDPAGGGARMQFPMEGKFSNPEALPQPSDARVQTKRVGERFVAAAKFPGVLGFPLDWEVASAERELRAALLRDGLSPAPGYRLARYNDPFTPPLLRRNEVLIDLPGFEWP